MISEEYEFQCLLVCKYEFMKMNLIFYELVIEQRTLSISLARSLSVSLSFGHIYEQIILALSAGNRTPPGLVCVYMSRIFCCKRESVR